MSRGLKINQYRDIKVGDSFKIINKPMTWASLLNDNDPFEANLKYPYYGTIIELVDDCGAYIAMTDGKYGWNLSSLINENLIINIKGIRKEKLLKLKINFR